VSDARIRQLEAEVARLTHELVATQAALHSVVGDPNDVGHAALVFCSCCGGNSVDVIGWTSPSSARFHCHGCGNESVVEGFTVGRFYGPASISKDVVRQAARDLARCRVHPNAFRSSP